MLQLPNCAEFDLKLSTESNYICLGLRGAPGNVEDVDCSVIQTYVRMGIFLQNQLATAHQFTWNNIQNIENQNNGLKLDSKDPVTGVVRNNRGDALLVQAIKVMTYTDNGYGPFTPGAGVNDIIADDANAPVEFFNMQGVKVSGDEPGLYIRRQGSKTSKIIVR